MVDSARLVRFSKGAAGPESRADGMESVETVWLTEIEDPHEEYIGILAERFNHVYNEVDGACSQLEILSNRIDNNARRPHDLMCNQDKWQHRIIVVQGDTVCCATINETRNTASVRHMLTDMILLLRAWCVRV